MNAIEKAISDTKFRIPKPILEAAFIKQQGYGGLHLRTPVSLDFKIREEVINARVMEDCNLVGGQEVTIRLDGVNPEFTADRKTIWRIPMSLTQNRRITRVYSLVNGGGGGGGSHDPMLQGGGMIVDATSGLLASYQAIPNVSFEEIRLVGENTVLAQLPFTASRSLFLRCVIENDEEFNNLPPAAIPRFSKLVELATKAYIYNTLIISIDSAQLSGGQELGRFLSIIEDYADSNELYEEEFQEKWRKVAIFADDQAKKRHLKMISGGRW